MAGPPVVTDDLKPLLPSGVEWISQTPFGWQRTARTPHVGLSTDRGFWGETDEGLRVTTRLAHDAGLKVLLKPHVWIIDPRDGSWRGEIEMQSEDGWRRWFASYRELVLHYAQLAQELDVEVLCVGTELRKTLLPCEDDWRRLLSEVRQVYAGKLTYAANWYQEYEEVPFWDLLDYAGIQAYFPLAEEERPSLKRLKAAWVPIVQRLERFHERVGRPILFTEIGYTSTPRAAIEPWGWPQHNGGWVGDADLQTQELCYTAFFESLWDRPWFLGAYFWKWYPQHDEAGGDHSLGFTPQNKPAQNVLARWYRRRDTPSAEQAEAP